MSGFPTSKIELHQWFNSILLVIVAFFGQQTLQELKHATQVNQDQEVRLGVHDERIAAIQETQRDIYNLVAVLPERIKPKKQ